MKSEEPAPPNLQRPRSRRAHTAVLDAALELFSERGIEGASIDSIKSFALPMTVGTISGCYSTICIAGPLWAMWQKRTKRPHKPAPKAQPKLKKKTA